MAKKNHVYERIEDESKTLEHVETREIEEALRAKADFTSHTKRGSPFSIAALRTRLLTDIVSTGGRPGRREAISRKKIPLTRVEWQILDEITKLIRSRGVSATSGQVAGVLLHQSITEVLLRLDRVTPARDIDNAASSTELADNELEAAVEDILAAAASAEVHLERLRPVALELLRRMRVGKGVEVDDKE